MPFMLPGILMSEKTMSTRRPLARAPSAAAGPATWMTWNPIAQRLARERCDSRVFFDEQNLAIAAAVDVNCDHSDVSRLGDRLAERARQQGDDGPRLDTQGEFMVTCARPKIFRLTQNEQDRCLPTSQRMPPLSAGRRAPPRNRRRRH